MPRFRLAARYVGMKLQIDRRIEQAAGAYPIFETRRRGVRADRAPGLAIQLGRFQ